MIKKAVLFFAVLIFAAPNVLAINVLLENQKFRQELSSMYEKQHAENAKNLMYYKGAPSYNGKKQDKASASSAKNVYEKKGVRFKVDEEHLKQAEAEKQQESSKQDKSEITRTPAETKKPAASQANSAGSSSKSAQQSPTTQPFQASSSKSNQTEKQNAALQERHNADAE